MTQSGLSLPELSWKVNMVISDAPLSRAWAILSVGAGLLLPLDFGDVD